MVDGKYKLTVCICTYNRYDTLGKAIDSALAQRLTDGKLEILVVDNSPDTTRSSVYGKTFATISDLNYMIESTPGLSNARNVAARACRAPIIAFMDDDAIAAPDWAQQLLRAFELAGAATMIVGGKVEPIWPAPRPPWLHDSLLGNLSVVDWGGELRVAAAHEWVAGANIAFRVEAILSNGGFPRNLGRIGSGSALLSNEEIELVAKVRATGGKLVYAPDACVRHLIDAKRLTQAWFRKRSAWQALSDFMMDPDRAAAEAREHWPGLVKYFNALPPLERTVRGLAFETDDPELFRWQTNAIYMMETLMLAGFEGVKLG